METSTTKIKYFIYARKSQESDEKQIQSIDDQVLTMDGIGKSYKLNIIDTITESKSARKPHGRPEFEKMIERIGDGEAQGILVWKTDRLFRNPVDSGTIQWLLQTEVIKSIRTPDREYLPEDNVLVLSVESGMATQYLRDLSKNVKRGLKSKLSKGWAPITAPLGYLNTKTEIRGANYIVKDLERFPLIRKAWDLMLTGNCTPPQILQKLNNEWGFRTRQWKKRGGKPMSRSTIYRIFTNQFYTGQIPYKGKLYKGNHGSMVTLEEFDKVQFLLGRKGKPRQNRYEYPFNGAIHCGECGGFISATFKEKIIKTTGKLKNYTLYYCTGARRSHLCSQRHYTNADIIERQVESEIQRFTILPEFKDWALATLSERSDKEINNRTKIYEMQQNTLNATQKKLDNLLHLRLSDMVDDEEYHKEKTRLTDELTSVKMKMRETETNTEKWFALTEEAFEFATYAHNAFVFGDPQKKREILSAIGLNCILKDHNINIEAANWLKPIIQQYPALLAQIKAFELEKKPYTEIQKEVFSPLYFQMRARRDLNPRSPP